MSKKEIRKINNLIGELEWQIIQQEHEIEFALKFPFPEVMPEEIQQRTEYIKECKKGIEELKVYKGEIK